MQSKIRIRSYKRTDLRAIQIEKNSMHISTHDYLRNRSPLMCGTRMPQVSKFQRNSGSEYLRSEHDVLHDRTLIE